MPDRNPPLIALIVAAADNDVIGRGGDLPWHQSSDLKRFKALTMGKPIIMGRKTYLSIGQPLPGRENIVITRDKNFVPPGAEGKRVHVVTRPDAAVALAVNICAETNCEEVMVIGGAEIYALLLPLADRVYLTRVHCAPEGDAVFPRLRAEDWRIVQTEDLVQGSRDDWPATVQIWERQK